MKNSHETKIMVHPTFLLSKAGRCDAALDLIVEPKCQVPKKIEKRG